MTDMETATRITGPCSCHEVYTSRGLIAPDCSFHDMAREIAEVLADARREALEEAAKVADQYTRLPPLYNHGTKPSRSEEAAMDTAAHIALDIRALSSPVKDTK